MDKLILEQLINEDLTQREIATRAGVSPTAVRYWLKKYGMSTQRMTKRSALYDESRLRNAVSECDSASGVLRLFGMRPAGGNHKTLSKYIAKYNIDTSHFLGNKCGRGGPSRKIANNEVFVRNSEFSGKLYGRLVEIGREELCSKCGSGTEWGGEPLRLQVDHINGVSNDHRKENLRFLCPNCHSQTKTYGGRNNGQRIQCYCIDCGVEVSSKLCKRCSACATLHAQAEKTNWPKIEELAEMVRNAGYNGASKKLGIRGNSIKRHIAAI